MPSLAQILILELKSWSKAVIRWLLDLSAAAIFRSANYFKMLWKLLIKSCNWTISMDGRILRSQWHICLKEIKVSMLWMNYKRILIRVFSINARNYLLIILILKRKSWNHKLFITITCQMEMVKICSIFERESAYVIEKLSVFIIINLKTLWVIVNLVYYFDF